MFQFGLITKVPTCPSAIKMKDEKYRNVFFLEGRFVRTQKLDCELKRSIKHSMPLSSHDIFIGRIKISAWVYQSLHLAFIMAAVSIHSYAPHFVFSKVHCGAIHLTQFDFPIDYVNWITFCAPMCSLRARECIRRLQCSWKQLPICILTWFPDSNDMHALISNNILP